MAIELHDCFGNTFHRFFKSIAPENFKQYYLAEIFDLLQIESMDYPLVSIIMSCYNSERFVADAVRSILSQTYQNFELIIVNDGSTDTTEEIVNSLFEPRIRYLYQENKGQDAALNNGFSYSSGKYIKFMDSDDLIGCKSLDIQVAALEQNPGKVAYGEWYRFFKEKPSTEDENKKMWYWKDMNPIDFLTVDQDGPMLQCGIMLMSRQLVLRSGLWDERLILYNDTEFFTRIVLSSKGVVFTPGAKLYYRSGIMSSLSVQQSRKYFESTFLASQLIEKQLLSYEDSDRIRRLIANIYFRRRYEMYPRYKDLAARHKKKIRFFGPSDLKVYGGKIHNLITMFFGWKVTVLIHRFYTFVKKYL